MPALGALAAEPLYVLVDTAIVGHLGTQQLASLAIAATVMTTAFTVFNFLTYGTTARVARLHGAGAEEDAAHLGAQAQWLSVILGVLLLFAIAALARPIVVLMGGEGEVADGATTYLRIAALGAPAFMLASAGQGYLRGIGDLKTPLVILVAAHAVNVVLELLFVYGFDWGLAGLGLGHRDRAARHGRRVPGGPAARRLAAAGARADARADADRVGDRGAHDGAARRRSSSPRRCSRGSGRRASARTRSRSSCSSSSRSCSTRSRSRRR